MHGHRGSTLVTPLFDVMLTIAAQILNPVGPVSAPRSVRSPPAQLTGCSCTPCLCSPYVRILRLLGANVSIHPSSLRWRLSHGVISSRPRRDRRPLPSAPFDPSAGMPSARRPIPRHIGEARSAYGAPGLHSTVARHERHGTPESRRDPPEAASSPFRMSSYTSVCADSLHGTSAPHRNG